MVISHGPFLSGQGRRRGWGRRAPSEAEALLQGDEGGMGYPEVAAPFDADGCRRQRLMFV
jgi:hypothetical protein